MQTLIIIALEMALVLIAATLIFYNRYRIRLLKRQLASHVADSVRLNGIVSELQVRSINKSAEVLDAIERTKTFYVSKIESLKSALSEEQKKRFASEESLAREKAAWIVRVEEEKRTAYEKGVRDGTKDYAIMCHPFIKESSSWIGRNKKRAGFRYHLMVKGIPALDSKDIDLQEVDVVDEKVRELIMSSAKAALSIMAESQGIPLHFAEQIKIEKT